MFCLCGVTETHRHVHGFCKYIPFALDIISQTFVPCRGENGLPLNPATLLADHPLISLTTTQGLSIRAEYRVPGPFVVPKSCISKHPVWLNLLRSGFPNWSNGAEAGDAHSLGRTCPQS